MKAVFLVIALVFSAVVISGCLQSSPDSVKALEDKVKALEGKVKKLQEKDEKLEMQVGVYKSLNDCKEKALVGFIDGNTGVQQTSLFDAFDRCDAIFSMMKALAESQG